MNYEVLFNLIALFFFSLTAIIVTRYWLSTRFSLNLFFPLLLSICLYAFVTISNILEHLGITDMFDSTEDIVELVFLFMCMFFINNWKSERALRLLQDREASLSAALSTISQQEEQYRYLIESADDAIFIIQNGKLQFFNKRTNDLLGYECAEITTKPFIEFVYLDDREMVATNYHRLLSKEQDVPSTYKFRAVTKTGTQLTIQVSSVYIDWQGSPATLSFARDITEFVKMEQSLFQAQKMESIGTLAGGIAHDFNNILTSIIGYTEIAKDSIAQDKTTTAYLDNVLTAGNRAKELVKQVLTFSRQSPHELQPVDMQFIISEALKLLRSSMPTTIEIQGKIDEEVGLVFADPTQLHQIVMNICTNAYHAMRENGGVLTVSLKKVEIGPDDFNTNGEPVHPGAYLELIVSDTGIGMKPDTLKYIFDPYFTTKLKGEGTGLGLSVVHGIVKHYGGYISVSSELGKGSSFHVYLPEISKEFSIHNPKADGNCPTGTEKILVIDDEAAIAALIDTMLSKLGYRVSMFTDSNMALQNFEKNPGQYDLVISDMTMPKLDGVGLLLGIKKVRADIPVILCTGFSDLIDQDKAISLGAQKLLMKPVNMRDLATAVRVSLDRQQK